jgi:hypothetical protein
MIFGPSVGSVIADPNDTKQSLRVFDDITAGRISIDEVCPFDDRLSSIIRSCYKLPRRSGHPELSQKPL